VVKKTGNDIAQMFQALVTI